MKISDALLKEKLKHVYFINGTAYAGKSTICKMLAETFDMYHCEENYKLDEFIKLTTPETHPNLHYFNTMSGWDEFVSRDKYEYVGWMEGCAKECIELEILELLSLPKDRLIIVDTNIPHEVLLNISDYNRVAYMVTTPEISRDEFFNRMDVEKQFILSKINETKNPKQTMSNFKETILYANRAEVIERYTKSGFFYTKRETLEDDILIKFNQIASHFKLLEKVGSNDKQSKIFIQDS